jgi:hypothetical protein
MTPLPPTRTPKPTRNRQQRRPRINNFKTLARHTASRTAPTFPVLPSTNAGIRRAEPLIRMRIFFRLCCNGVAQSRIAFNPSRTTSVVAQLRPGIRVLHRMMRRMRKAVRMWRCRWLMGFLIAMRRSMTEQARTTTEIRRVRSQMAPGLTRRENMRCRRLVEASPLLQSQRWKHHHSLLPLNEAVGVYSDGCIRGEY